MKFCTDHWDKLKKAIEDRGLMHLVAKNSKEAHANLVADLKDDNDLSNYNPLMDCYLMITSRALELGGLYLLVDKEDGSQYCPVCEAIAHGQTESEWIDGPTDAVLKFCREKGLVPLPS